MHSAVRCLRHRLDFLTRHPLQVAVWEPLVPTCEPLVSAGLRRRVVAPRWPSVTTCEPAESPVLRKFLRNFRFASEVRPR